MSNFFWCVDLCFYLDFITFIWHICRLIEDNALFGHVSDEVKWFNIAQKRKTLLNSPNNKYRFLPLLIRFILWAFAGDPSEVGNRWTKLKNCIWCKQPHLNYNGKMLFTHWCVSINNTIMCYIIIWYSVLLYFPL